MVMLVACPYESRRMENRLISNWRPGGLVAMPSVDSSLATRIDVSEIDEEFALNSVDSRSEASFKLSTRRTVSDYWRDVLRYHWPIVIQSIFLAAAIVALGPWIGSTCNEPVVDEDRSILWRFPIVSEFNGDTTIVKPTCTHGFCCFTHSIEGSSSRRRASFLKRKRITKIFDDF